MCTDTHTQTIISNWEKGEGEYENGGWITMNGLGTWARCDAHNWLLYPGWDGWEADMVHLVHSPQSLSVLVLDVCQASKKLNWYKYLVEKGSRKERMQLEATEHSFPTDIQNISNSISPNLIFKVWSSLISISYSCVGNDMSFALSSALELQGSCNQSNCA